MAGYIAQEIHLTEGDLIDIYKREDDPRLGPSYVFRNVSKDRSTIVPSSTIEAAITAATNTNIIPDCLKHLGDWTGADWVKEYLFNHPAKPVRRNQLASFDVILLISHHIDEAREFAETVLGVPRSQWHWVTGYRDMMRYRHSSVYVLPTARMRDDFEAIQGLFIQCAHSVTDLDMDE